MGTAFIYAFFSVCGEKIAVVPDRIFDHGRGGTTGHVALADAGFQRNRVVNILLKQGRGIP